MSTLEVSARMTVRPGKLEGFKRQAAEVIRQTKAKDTRTLRYEWFLNADQTECEIREAYESAGAEPGTMVAKAMEGVKRLDMQPRRTRRRKGRGMV